MTSVTESEVQLQLHYDTVDTPSCHREQSTQAPADNASRRAPLSATNGHRHQVSAGRQVADAQAILDDPELREQLLPRQREALEARIAHPEATLAELGRTLGCTKDTYAALLRRGLLSRTVRPAYGAILDNDALRARLSPRQRAALEARVAYPSATLAELAQLSGCTKDTFAALLHRGVEAAEVALFLPRAAHPAYGAPARAQQVADATAILDRVALRIQLSRRQLAALEARVEHPDATTAELAQVLGCTEAACAGLILRGLRTVRHGADTTTGAPGQRSASNGAAA